MFKKLISLTLAVIMVMALVAIPGSAEEKAMLEKNCGNLQEFHKAAGK